MATQLVTTNETYQISDLVDVDSTKKTFVFEGKDGHIVGHVAYLPTPFGFKVFFDAEVEEIFE